MRHASWDHWRVASQFEAAVLFGTARPDSRSPGFGFRHPKRRPKKPTSSSTLKVAGTGERKTPHEASGRLKGGTLAAEHALDERHAVAGRAQESPGEVIACPLFGMFLRRAGRAHNRT